MQLTLQSHLAAFKPETWLLTICSEPEVILKKKMRDRFSTFKRQTMDQKQVMQTKTTHNN